MFHDLGIQTQHIFIRPCENIWILSEKLEDLLLNPLFQCSTNLDLPLIVFGTQVDQLNLLLVGLNGFLLLFKQSGDLIWYIIIFLIFGFKYREFKSWKNHRITVFNGFIVVQSS